MLCACLCDCSDKIEPDVIKLSILDAVFVSSSFFLPQRDSVTTHSFCNEEKLNAFNEAQNWKH